MVDQLKELASTYPYEHYLQRLNEHFEAYCIDMNLMPRSNHILRAMACGQSFDLNVKHKFYFDLASRGYSDFNYLGIYKGKTVQYIGKVENMICANWDSETGLDIKDAKFDVTQEQKERLVTAIQDSLDKGWGVHYEHRFFLLKEFEKTDFRKKSPGGIFRVRYFNLEEILKNVPEDMATIAQELQSKDWE